MARNHAMESGSTHILVNLAEVRIPRGTVTETYPPRRRDRVPRPISFASLLRCFA